MIQWLKNKLQRRNFAVAYRQYAEQVFWTNWSLEKAVRDGCKASGWVYRAVFLISKSAAAVPWRVKNTEGEILKAHHLSQLLRKPNPHISKQDIIEMMTAWLELSGNSYLYKVRGSNNRTAELYPVSPDRLKPIISKQLTGWISGYALDQSQKVTFQPEDIIHHVIFPDPANPFIGLSPLEVAGKTVDIDVSQKNFNYTSSQNRGVLDGVFTFDRFFSNQKETDAIAQQIEEKYGKKRGFIVLGSNAQYQRIGLNPAEMDFTESRKANRDEILAIFGVPPQLVGAMEASTYNNFQTSELIFWTCTMIPLLDDLADTFNHTFDNELGDGEEITYDISKIPAIRRALQDRAGTAKILYDMGVPFSQVNRIFDFGVEEYEGWDISKPASVSTVIPADIPMARKRKRETRSATDEAKNREKYADKKILPVFTSLLDNQKELVIADIFNKNIEEIIREDTLAWQETWLRVYVDTGIRFGKDTEFRSAEDEIQALIEEYLDSEQVVLTELSLIGDTTAAAIVLTVEQALTEGWATAEIQQAIDDMGVFSPSRSLALARTISGTAASIGQWKTAENTGADEKVWRTAGDKQVRDVHRKMEGETRKINERYSNGAMYPLDPVLSAAQRINCRCSQLFF